MNAASRVILFNFVHTKVVKGLHRLLFVIAFQFSFLYSSGVLFICLSGFNCSQISTVIYSTLAWFVYTSVSINVFLLLSSHYNELCFSITIFSYNPQFDVIFRVYILVLYCKEKVQILNWFVLLLLFFF